MYIPLSFLYLLHTSIMFICFCYSSGSLKAGVDEFSTCESFIAFYDNISDKIKREKIYFDLVFQKIQ